MQLRSCPWCGDAIAHTDYRASKELLHFQIRCPNEKCDFHGTAADPMTGIPAFVVDEDGNRHPLGIESGTVGPRGERSCLPVLGSLSFLAFIDSRKR